jgi:hypothetical protein
MPMLRPSACGHVRACLVAGPPLFVNVGGVNVNRLILSQHTPCAHMRYAMRCLAFGLLGISRTHVAQQDNSARPPLSLSPWHTFQKFHRSQKLYADEDDGAFDWAYSDSQFKVPRAQRCRLRLCARGRACRLPLDCCAVTPWRRACAAAAANGQNDQRRSDPAGSDPFFTIPSICLRIPSKSGPNSKGRSEQSDKFRRTTGEGGHQTPPPNAPRIQVVLVDADN